MPILTLAELKSIQADAFADDVDITACILAWNWSAEEATAFFESGGAELPRCALQNGFQSAQASVPFMNHPPSDCDLDSARSSLEGWVACASGSPALTVSRDVLGEQERHLVDGGNSLDDVRLEERTEDALVDVPMASVPVTTLAAPPQSPFASSAPAVPMAQPSARAARLARDMENIIETGDAAFRASEFATADRHYSSALRLASSAPANEPLPVSLISMLYSNRSAARVTLNRPLEALDDGRSALELRPTWARAHCRVGAALVALCRYDEARATYERGLEAEPGSAELQAGLSEVLERLVQGTCGARYFATTARERGNLAFKAGRLQEAIGAYTEAIGADPSDETLYSDRSAALIAIGRHGEALQDAKRVISLQPRSGTGYTQAGLAALRANDEEAAYWFFANGLRVEPSNGESSPDRTSHLSTRTRPRPHFHYGTHTPFSTMAPTPPFPRWPSCLLPRLSRRAAEWQGVDLASAVRLRERAERPSSRALRA